MKQSFDEWFIKASQNKLFWESPSKSSKMGYEAGAESRQSEIDELQKKYDAMHRAFTVADDARKEWHLYYIGVRQREDELQKRIDKAIIELSKVSSMHVINSREILKGKQND